MYRLMFLSLCGLLFSTCQNADKAESLTDTFEIAEGFQFELVASEPLISDPVDMEIDELGRMFVVEMHGYPLDVSGSGVIKRLMDTDGDGLPDKSSVFLDGLVLPTGIMRWKQGFLITDPPNVLYIEDADEDGIAEIRDTILTGFARSNPQHNVNNPMYGLDNWIYLSHEGAVRTQDFADVLGDQGSEVHFYEKTDGTRLPQNANGLGVRFKPRQQKVEMLSARGQFGHTFDEWGHHFLTSNADHLWHEAIARKYVGRNSNFLLSSGRQYLPKSGRGFAIYPITTNPDHQLLTDIGVMTSACGILWYQGGLFGSEFNHTVFTAEPVHNLVHVDVIQEKGATFESSPFYEGREFLASKDSWFRPVNHYIGPDGAIYLLDYHRKIIEHPEWLSQEVINSGALYEGSDLGRIYRISPVGTSAMSFLDKLDLGALDADQLLEKLASKNIWWRSHAQRLLMDRDNDDVPSKIREFFLSNNASEGKVHALWLLEGKGVMDAATLSAALSDPSAGVRENAIKMAEIYLDTFPQLEDQLVAMISDQHAKVRYQLLLTLGSLNSDKVVEARERLLEQNIEDVWMQHAALSAKTIDLDKMFHWSALTFKERESEGSISFFAELAEMTAKSASSGELNKLLKGILSLRESNWYDPIVMQGLTSALLRNQSLKIDQDNIDLLTAQFAAESDSSLRYQSLQVLHAAGYFANVENPLLLKALAVLSVADSEVTMLADAIRVIGWTPKNLHISKIKRAFYQNYSPQVRAAVVGSLADAADTPAVCDTLISIWPDLLIEERNKCIAALLKSDFTRKSLLQAIVDKRINPSSLSWPQTVSLLNSSNHEMRNLARSVLQGNELNANVVWQEYESCLQMKGAATDGAAVFKGSCGSCHQISGKNGTHFGPDLSAIKNRNKAAIMLDILQPNKSIADGYELWTIETKSEEYFTGIISAQGPNTITIKDATGKETTLERGTILTSKVSEISAMPENLQMQLSLQDMADLLTFLKNG